jgi:two-component system cell cycle response regulator
VHKPKHILVADDDPVTVQMLSGVLKGGGFDVSVAVDAMQAVMMAIRTPPDAVLLDIGMPGGTGFQVLERLKATSKTSAVPVIVVTALTDPALQARVRGLGARDFFTKPIAPDRLLQALQRVLEPPADETPAS